MSTTEAPHRRYGIAEAAAVTGFSSSALRYYEGAGVLPPPARTAAGYRSYDDRDLDRLRLIARAKDLGCTLEEIGDLVEVRDEDRCAPVKHRLRSLVDEKARAVERLIAEQSAFATQLRRTAEALSARPLDGPCEETCGCTTPVDGSGPPIACSLAGDEVDARLAAWRDVLWATEGREPITDGFRLHLEQTAPVATIAALAVAEHRCCPFLRFALTIDDRGVALEVTAPLDGQELLRTLLGIGR